MIYSFPISTPANTTAASPQVTDCKIEKGLIKELFVNFPPGPSGLLYLQIEYHEVKIFPMTKNYFHGDNMLFEFHDVGYKLSAAPFLLKAITWNTDDTFAHNVDIYINLIRTGIFL